MALSGPATAGLIMAIVVILLFSLAALYYTKRRSRQNAPPKATDPTSPTDSGSPAISSLLRLKGINKRSEISDPQHQDHEQHHTRFPSLEQGPGPTLITFADPETRTISTIRAVIATPMKSSSSARVQPSNSAASNNRSSLHQAVLDVGAGDGQKSDNAAVEEVVDVTTAKDLKHNPVGKAYAGTWPVRDANG
ncbi:hypothetical protein G6011_11287 [Alternaria panax]|uniref:Uncharacterized protein n=1 Tax=Alternaria panax TaxID=48097 RepID=A0AAD4IDJ5_9PLEO|nr:hypothetical protein G6011_11287 [Alternaria panax]